MTFWQTILAVVTAIAAGIGAVSAVIIGVQQISVAARRNYTEIFVHPSQGNTDLVVIRNASSYPIYLTRFVINGMATDTGSTALPNDTQSWYNVLVPGPVVDSKQFTLEVFFEDYSGKKYSAESNAKLLDAGWSIHSKKRIVIEN